VCFIQKSVFAFAATLFVVWAWEGGGGKKSSPAPS